MQSQVIKFESRFLAASAAGTLLEFLDFALYAHTSTIFAHYFFPSNTSQFFAIFLTWLPFLVGFLVRPIGAIVFGLMGDKIGCRATLCISMLLMASSTIGIGLIPDYSQIGWFAPLFLLLFRVMQGFAVSPEYNGAGVYLSQIGIKKNYYLKTSLTCVMTGMGMMLGSLIISYMTKDYLIADLPAWRWRLPYVVSGLLLGTVGLILRLSMDAGKPNIIEKNPLTSAWNEERYACIEAFLVSGYVGMVSYCLFGFFSAFLQIQRGFLISDALRIISYCSILIIFVNVSAAYLADRYGQAKVMSFAALSVGYTVLLTFLGLNYGSRTQIILGVLLFGLTTGLFTGVLPGYLAKRFAAKHRYTGSCLMYNLGIAIFGGLTPMTFFYLSKINFIWPVCIIMLYSVIIYTLLKPKNSKIAYEFATEATSTLQKNN